MCPQGYGRADGLPKRTVLPFPRSSSHYLCLLLEWSPNRQGSPRDGSATRDVVLYGLKGKDIALVSWLDIILYS
ncbi:hypothetical protein KQX54_017523 [Cotesia glomerata]|uniref:Uncharacterized protein n=1 Tax=Cotesia glomerata TaxID=32391 RepID=A0AAV7IZJ2_COTGL|nr:hypothetical protein KQX54_017523 [Cotesia glomerata]